MYRTLVSLIQLGADIVLFKKVRQLDIMVGSTCAE